jgi:putative flippase GtrA
MKQLEKFIRSSLFRYILIGGITFGIEFAAFWVLLNVIKLDALPANMISLLISFSFNFVMSNYWTFKAGNSQNAQKLVKYLSLVAVNYVLNNAIFYVINGVLLVSPGLTKVIVTILQTSWTFLIYKFWIFKGSKIENDPQVVM